MKTPHAPNRSRVELARILFTVLACLTLAIVLPGCSGTSEGTQVETAPPEAALAAVERQVTVPAGSVLTVAFSDSLGSDVSIPGDRFEATVIDSIYVGETAVIEAGDVVVGEVIEAKPAKKIGGKALLNLRFDSVQTSNGTLSVDASFVDAAKGQAKKDAATIGGATAGGAILGRIVGHRQGDEADGTAIGALVGAAVGTAIAASNEGQEVAIPAGTVVDLTLDSPVDVLVRS
jgi:hypothetical protein